MGKYYRMVKIKSVCKCGCVRHYSFRVNNGSTYMDCTWMTYDCSVCRAKRTPHEKLLHAIFNEFQPRIKMADNSHFVTEIELAKIGGQ